MFLYSFLIEAAKFEKCCLLQILGCTFSFEFVITFNHYDLLSPNEELPISVIISSKDSVH